MSVKLVPTICPYCGCGCGLNLVVKDAKVAGVEPWKRHPINEGKLCPKGNFAHEFIHSPDRLTQPLIRKNGRLEPSTWAEALDYIAERLLQIKAAHGPGSIACLSSAKATNEENYLMQKFARAAIGTPNIDHCARLCHSPTVAGLSKALGSGAMTNTIKDIEEARCILVIGSNTVEAHPLVARRVLRAKETGAKIIVADPRFNATAKHADIYAPMRSGTDAALLSAMMQFIIAEKLYNADFIGARTRGFEKLKASVLDCSPQWASRVTGVPASTIREMAVAYASRRPATILYSMGITQHTTGTDNVLAIADLALLTGNVGRRGSGVNPLRGQNNVQGACDMGALPDVLPGYKPVTDDEWRAFVSGEWQALSLPSKPGLTMLQMMSSIDSGGIKAMYVMGDNPVVSDPDAGHVERSLASLDLLVVQDIFLSETARLAHVVLPAASFAEKQGTFTNTERRVQLIRKAVAPPGEAKADWEIICLLAKKMGAKGFSFESPEDIFDELRRLTPQYAGITYARLADPDGIHWPCPDESHPGTPLLHASNFSTPDGLGEFFEFRYRPPAEEADDEYPYLLTTGRILHHYHTGTMTRRSPSLNAEVSRGYAEINEADAGSLGIADGDMVRLRSRRGEIEIAARVTADVVRGIVFVPFHFAEACANKLTNAAADPACGMPELKVCAVRVEPVRTEKERNIGLKECVV